EFATISIGANALRHDVVFEGPPGSHTMPLAASHPTQGALLMNAMLILGLLVTADDATKDATAIQGTWVIESVIDNGKPNQEIKGDRMVFKDGTITVKRQ